MSYSSQKAFMSDARDAQFNARSKLADYEYAGAGYSDGDSDEEDQWSGDDEEESWYSRPEVLWAAGGLVALTIIAGLFVHSLGSSTSQQHGLDVPAPAPAPVVWSAPAPAPVVQTTTLNPLLPSENLHDNNVCAGNEEYYGGLCYKRCSILTDGSHPIRTSSWTCCESHPCGVSNQLGKAGSTILCNGYDVGGGGGCPHQAGTCLLNEELLLGVCYEKCALLTNGQFPVRVGPASCCMTKGMGCFDIRKEQTSPKYNTGGGVGDGDDSTPGEAHYPLTNLTESGGVEAVSTAAPSVETGSGGYIGSGVSCEVDEEYYAGLCYKKCELLTNGTHPIRTSSWTCCESHPCGLSNQKGSVGDSVVCQGYDIGGQGAFNVPLPQGSQLPCPHKPFPCEDGEDQILGVCYKSCSKLTDGQFPYRLTAATCCQETGLKACLNIGKLSTSATYNTR